MFPYKEDLFRFDFEADAEDENMCRNIGDGIVKGLLTPPGVKKISSDTEAKAWNKTQDTLYEFCFRNIWVPQNLSILCVFELWFEMAAPS